MLFGSTPGVAASLQDLQIAARVLTFQKTRPRGQVRLAVVYNPEIAASRQAADALVRAASPSLKIDDLDVVPVLVSQSKLASVQAVAGVMSVAGVDDQVLDTALARLRVPCLSTDITQVRSGACTVAISSEPRVSIIVNSHNAEARGVRFATAFLMMVREI